jgi:hypothetical protein
MFLLVMLFFEMEIWFEDVHSLQSLEKDLGPSLSLGPKEGGKVELGAGKV